MGFHAINVDPTSMPSGVTGSEVKFSSKSNEALNTTVSRTLNVADQVAAAWQEKIKAEGKTVWFSPIDPRENRKEFPTKAKCLAHMKKHNKKQIEALQLQGKPETAYTPRSRTIAPKRTLEDLVTPQQAALMRKAQAAQDATSDLRALSLAAAGGDLKATSVVTLPEGMAIPKLAKLSDAELKVAAQLLWSRGRKPLLVHARKICAERGIPLNF